MAQITIIGTGLIGSSLGLALRAARSDLIIVGHDRDPARAAAAKKLGAVDRTEWNLPAAVEGAGLIVVAIPLDQIERTLEVIGACAPPGAIVTDTAELKAPVLRWASHYLAGRAHFVGGHPIVGATGETGPNATLFQGHTYGLMAADDASEDAIEQVTRLVHLVGGTPLFLDPVEHDSQIGLVEQLPSLLAATFMAVADASPAWRDGKQLAGPRFGHASQLAMRGAFQHAVELTANRETLVPWILLFRDQLGELARALQDDDREQLVTLLERADLARRGWRQGSDPEPGVTATELPGVRDQLSGWLFGNPRLRPRKP